MLMRLLINRLMMVRYLWHLQGVKSVRSEMNTGEVKGTSTKQEQPANM